MDLINWSLNAIDTIFSTRSLGSGEPNCPAGTFASGYVMDGWEKWRVVCLAALSLEDVEDVYLFGTLITGFLLMGIGGVLGYRRLVKAVSAAQNPTKLAGRIKTVVGRAVSTQTVAMGCKMENIMEKLAALSVLFGLHRLTHTHTQLQIDNSLPYPISHAFVCFLPPGVGGRVCDQHFLAAGPDRCCLHWTTSTPLFPTLLQCYVYVHVFMCLLLGLLFSPDLILS
ncbi:hypothetical protein QQF64_036062 [Cirrhinus molitorella]|uniref:Uncharacterized protein n=1 Tax=Cirrhinus molitorella TaxID=172907 RepID=A0ABR3NHQ7_9TELE